MIVCGDDEDLSLIDVESAGLERILRIKLRTVLQCDKLSRDLSRCIAGKDFGLFQAMIVSCLISNARLMAATLHTAAICDEPTVVRRKYQMHLHLDLAVHR